MSMFGGSVINATVSRSAVSLNPGTSDIEDDSLDASIRAMSISPRRPGHNNSNRHPSIASVLHVKEEEAPVKLGQYSTHLDAGSRVTTLPAGHPLARPPPLIIPSFEDLRLRNRVDPSDPYGVPFLNPWSKEYFISDPKNVKHLFKYIHSTKRFEGTFANLLLPENAR
ncbi:hypothetical protein BV22DRAFT_1199282 [Leucogyrophana mollusca]|uniref:Uncharacterized protein n=1 Tax=Leucogyrophana mollusca TaxID=85980 RepID=A0ACB8B2Y7_9AGAM|nr:hypothetical protein BV22DRAFT_1199282 [Leucogyrophana mollusca]